MRSKPARSPSPVPSSARALAATENQILDLINRERSRVTVPALTRNRALDSAARYHALNMAKLRTMSHVLPGTSAPTLPDRARMVHYVYSRVAENIAHGQRSADEVVQNWMNSTGHRESILDQRLTETGIGIARAANGGLYFCQVFGRPR